MLIQSKSTSCLLIIAGCLFLLLTGCNFLHHPEPDAFIEIDLTRPGKMLNFKMNKGVVIDFIHSFEAQAGAGKGSLNNALQLATRMIAMENSGDSLKSSSYATSILSKSDPTLIEGLVVTRGSKLYMTPNFYVMQMFSENKPDKVMPLKVSLKVEDSSKKSIYATAGLHDKSGMVIIKIVNSFDKPKNCRIMLNYKRQIKYKGEAIVLTSTGLSDGNSFSNPEKVVPMTKEMKGLRNTFDYKCPAHSVVIIHLRYKKGINGMGNCC